MDAATLPRAIAAATAIAANCGLRVVDALVVHDSNRLVVHLRPCDVLARVAPRVRREEAESEVRVAGRLTQTGAPVASLDPRVEPRVYIHDEFAVTLWTYYEAVPPHDVMPREYAGALERLHAGMRRVGSAGDSLPHFTDRVDDAQRVVNNATNQPWIAGPDRELLATTLRGTRSTLLDRGAPEQLLHGEPHRGNLLRASDGLLFVDLETCCRGPIEFDIAHATGNAGDPPTEVAAHYIGADRSLVHECWILTLAMISAWRCEPGDDLPNGRAIAMDCIHRLRAALDG